MLTAVSLAVITSFILSFAVAVAQEGGAFISGAAVVQEDRLTIETRDRNTPAMRGLTVEELTRPRVPDGFGPLVTAAQREEIHKIQAEYHELISLLQLRIDLLTQERNIKYENVLTPAQLQRLSPVNRERLRPARLAPARNLLQSR